MKKIIIFTNLLLLVFLPGISFAAVDDIVYTYVFHLYYDNGQLFADRDFEFSYDLIAEEFASEEITVESPHTGEILNFKGDVLATFQFDLQKGDPDFSAGKISVKAPYFANASDVNFYDSARQLLLSLSVGESSFCNEDSVCNAEVGENAENCPADCQAPVVVSPILPPSKIGAPTAVIIALVLVVVIILIWRLWLKKKRTKTQEFIQPPSSLG